MVDIAKCNRRDCPDKKTCFRYLAMPEEFFQSYLIIDTPTLEKGQCPHYWRCRNARELAYMNKVNK